MIFHRLTSIVAVHRLWDFFKEGIEYEAKYLRYSHSMDVYRRIVWHLVSRGNPKGWVAVAFADTEGTKPVAFILAHDISPLFAETREFEVSMFYFIEGWKQAIPFLQNRLDAHCRENGISRYYLTTSSFCSSATKVFNQSWRGLERSNTVFKRDLK